MQSPAMFITHADGYRHPVHQGRVVIDGKHYHMSPGSATSRYFFRVMGIDGKPAFYVNPAAYFTHRYPTPHRPAADDDSDPATTEAAGAQFRADMAVWVKRRDAFLHTHAVAFAEQRAAALCGADVIMPSAAPS